MYLLYYDITQFFEYSGSSQNSEHPSASISDLNFQWMPEDNRCKENAKFLLIGLKSDLRHDLETIDRLNISKKIFVSRADAENMAKKLEITHIECSAKVQVRIICKKRMRLLYRIFQENFEELMGEIIELGKMVETDHETCTVMSWLSNIFCFRD